MTTKNQLQDTLLTSQMRSFFETYPFPSFIVYIDEYFTIASANRAFINTSSGNKQKEQVKNPVGKSLFVINPKNKDSFKEALEQVLSTKEALKTNITVHEFDSGDTDKETELSRPVLTPILNDHGEVDCIICSPSSPGTTMMTF